MITGAAQAQLVDRPVRIVTTFPPGGHAEVIARLVGDKLSARINRPVIVEGKPGGGGLVAVKHLMLQEPDGSTLMLSSTTVGIGSAKPDAQFDVRRDLRPIFMLYRGNHTVWATPTLPVNSMKELIAYEKANPDKLSYGSFGVGSQVHLAFEYLNQLTGMKLTHVPYRGQAESLVAVQKGEVQLSMEPYKTLKPLVDSGRAKALAFAGPARDPDYPDLPSVAESGLPQFDISYWFGLHAPAAMSDELAQRYNAHFTEILKDPDVLTLIKNLGAKPAGGSIASFTAFLDADIKRWAEVIRKGDLKL
jgi:tripartite-type tricarboxylate transporter receptor subunit TctC